MKNYRHNIKIINSNRNFGYFDGKIDDYSWYVIVQLDKVDEGINPITLKKGDGCITKLCIYNDTTTFEGNPYLPAMTIRRKIYANYQNEWIVLNSSNINMIKDLIDYIEMRNTVHLVSC